MFTVVIGFAKINALERRKTMKFKKILLLLPFLLVGCKENTSTSTSVQETILLEKHFSKANDDSFENFFAKGWSTANSKFGANSVILLEDANHKYGSSYVRTPKFEETTDIKISLTIQVTGFNNATSINNFLDQTFKFGVFLLNENNEAINDTDLIFEHKITQSDCDNKYFSSLNNYSSSWDSNPNLKLVLPVKLSEHKDYILPTTVIM